jgi:hypothetical protein
MEGLISQGNLDNKRNSITKIEARWKLQEESK